MKEKIHEPAAREAVLELIKEEEIEEVFRYLEIYRNSLSDETEIEDVEDLIHYYENNREGSYLTSPRTSSCQNLRKD